MSARYAVTHMRGVAFWIKGYATVSQPCTSFVIVTDDDGEPAEVEVENGEFDEVEDRERVVAVMVGDDQEHIIDVDNLELLDDDAYCGQCGQIGCTHDGR